MTSTKEEKSIDELVDDFRERLTSAVNESALPVAVANLIVEEIARELTKMEYVQKEQRRQKRSE